MRNGTPKIWLNISIINLCIVAALGVIMRTKIIFDLPWIDYNLLVDAHGNFAFTGWVTIALLTLMLYEFRGIPVHKKVYTWLLGGMALGAWALLLTSPFALTHKASEYILFFYTFLTYIFAWRFIADLRKTSAGKTVKTLAVSAVIYMVLSSAGTIMVAWLFAVKSLNAILYRDALFGYLHMQYNGFFSLSVFAIAFNKQLHKMNERAKTNAFRFSVLLSASIIPSMFITFLWYDSIPAFHIISVLASILLFITFIWLILTSLSLKHQFKSLIFPVRMLVFLALGAFAVKLLLQSLTLFHTINILVFGNRSVIMGFLHLVFLGFVTLFLIAYFTQTGVLNIGKPITRWAIYSFALAVITNEVLLFAQGIGTMITANVLVFNLFLWIAGLMLLCGALLVALARICSPPCKKISAC